MITYRTWLLKGINSPLNDATQLKGLQDENNIKSLRMSMNEKYSEIAVRIIKNPCYPDHYDVFVYLELWAENKGGNNYEK